jgi:hypothetical protein
MAVTNTAVVFLTLPASNLATLTVAATADADTTTGNIAHLMPFTPDFAIVTPILPQGALKAWSWAQAATDGTNISFVGNNVAGSGVAGASLRVWFGRLHSLVR